MLGNQLKKANCSIIKANWGTQISSITTVQPSGEVVDISNSARELGVRRPVVRA